MRELTRRQLVTCRQLVATEENEQASRTAACVLGCSKAAVLKQVGEVVEETARITAATVSEGGEPPECAGRWPALGERVKGRPSPLDVDETE